jgi:signal transduction histidine kinase
MLGFIAMTENEKPEQQWLELAGHLLHDLHSPLLAALQATRLLSKAATEGRETMQAQMAYAACSQAAAILANVEFLWRERFSLGQPYVKDRLPVPELRVLLSEVTEILGLVYGPGRAVQIEFRCSDSLAVIADRQVLSHVFRNVLENAFRYSFAKSAIRVTVESRSTTSLVIRVASHGLPIEKDEIDKCFALGFRGREALMNLPGAGLGLYVAARLLRNQGGRLTIKSQENLTMAMLHVRLEGESNEYFDS